MTVSFGSSITCDTPHYENEVPFEVPEGWEWTTIGEIASSILYGVSESAKETGQYKLLRITDIQNNKVNWETVPFTDYDNNKAQAYLLNDGDILFARTGATVGKSYLVEGLRDSAIYASYLIRVQTSSAILPAYIKFFFESGFYWEQISLNSVGIGQPNVNGTTLAALTIPIPPYREQLRIVEEAKKWLSVIDGLDVEIEDLQASITQAKSKILDLAIHGKLVPQDPNDEPAIELLKRINPKFVPCDNAHYENVPQGWMKIAFKETGYEILNGFAFRSDSYVEKGIKVIRITNVQDGYICDDDPKYYPIGSRQEIEKYMLNENDLLMSLTGNVGRVGFLNKEMLPAALNQRVGCLRGSEKIIDKEYLYYYFQSESFKKDCLESAKGVAQLNISTEWLKSYGILLPPLSEQKRITNKVKELFMIINSISAEL